MYNMNRTARVVNIFIIGISLFATCWANNNLQTKFKWNIIDFKYESAKERRAAIDNQTFIPQNVIPVGLDIHEERLFLSLPRLKRGVPASLAVIDLNELSENDGPALQPYPSWQSHQIVNSQDNPDIVSPFHIKVDRCDHLWALDTGIDGILNATESKRIAPVRIIVFDLRMDDIFRKYALPSVNLNNSIFSNIAIDDNDCDDIFAYVADAGTPSLIVYSLKLNESWQIKHNFFNIDPLAGNFSLLGTKFQTHDGLYGLALTEKKENGYPDLYFHALTSHMEFNVSTSVLRDKSSIEGGSKFYKSFNIIGKRNTNEQAGVSVYDKVKKTIFYTLPNNNEIACWKTTNKNYSVSNVFTSVTEMVYPIDIKIDNKERLWILSNNMQDFLTTKLDITKPNFYIHVVPLTEAVKNTPCEPNFVEKLIKKLNGDSNGKASDSKSITFLTVIAIIMVSIKQIF